MRLRVGDSLNIAVISAIGISKSINSALPIYAKALSSKKANFHRPKQNVRVAQIAVPKTAPVSVCKPEGTSILKTNFFQLLIRLIAAARG